MPPQHHHADVLVIGWGLAGLVAASEAAAAGRTVVIVDQESRANLGGQAFWSFGGLFFVDSPEQRANRPIFVGEVYSRPLIDAATSIWIVSGVPGRTTVKRK